MEVLVNEAVHSKHVKTIRYDIKPGSVGRSRAVEMGRSQKRPQATPLGAPF
jgi:hypothetical protein